MAYLRLRAVVKSYDGYSNAVDNISIAVERGEFVTFLGPSGSGKTTTLLMIAGFETPTSGIIELENWTAWSRALGYLPVELSGKSLRELMPLGHAAAGEVVAALLDTAAVEPLDVTLRCKDQRRKRLRLHRRFDPHEQAVFLLAEELSAV